MFDVPVAFFVYRRPDLTSQVFQAIRSIRPRKLLVVADGPKHPEDAAPCAEVRALIEGAIDWPCQLETNYSAENMGVARRVSSGLDWVFGRVDRAIILEDDVLPDISFFEFCRQLLLHYEKDASIMQISGTNLAGEIRTSDSYCFSNFTIPPWGWATWARWWETYDFSMRRWDEERHGIQKRLGKAFPYWDRFTTNYKRDLPSWDLQWNVSVWAQRGLTVIPAVNLTSNIGFGERATFTKMHNSRYADLKRLPCPLPLRHPTDLAGNVDDMIEPALRRFFDEFKDIEDQG